MENSTTLPPVRPIQGRATTNLSSNGLAGSAPVQRATFGQKVLAGLGNLAGSVAGSSSGVGLLGSLINGGLQMYGEHKQYERQKEMYAMQRADALADYERQRGDYLSDLADERAYNTPAAQAARLKAAGINPNTVFGSGSVANTSSPAENTAGVRGSTPTSPGSSGLGSAFAQGFTASSSGMLQSGALDVQAEQARSNIELQKAQMLKMLSETKGIDASTKRQWIENGYLDMFYASDIRERNQRVIESLDRMETSALERASLDFDLKYLKPSQVTQFSAAIQKLYSETRSLILQNDYFSEMSDYRKQSELYNLSIKKSESIISDFEKSVAGLRVPDNARTGFGRFYRRLMQEVDFVTKSALGWFSASYNFGNKKK